MLSGAAERILVKYADNSARSNSRLRWVSVSGTGRGEEGRFGETACRVWRGGVGDGGALVRLGLRVRERVARIWRVFFGDVGGEGSEFRGGKRSGYCARSWVRRGGRRLGHVKFEEEERSDRKGRCEVGRSDSLEIREK